MFLSSREKNIVQILLEQKNGMTVDYLSKKLNVSKRTIYREISSLESSLAPLQLQLVRESDGYQLMGEESALSDLKQQMNQSPNELSVQQRQSLLVIQLLMEEHEVKMEYLANELGVSISTIQSDLQSIEELFEAYQIDIIRKKAKGIKAIALETNRRLIITGLITSEINSYNFFSLFMKDQEDNREKFENSANPFLKLLNFDDVKQAYLAIKDISTIYFKEVTDIQYQRLVILLSLSIKRMRDGEYVSSLMIDENIKSELQENNSRISREILNHLQTIDIIESFSLAEVFFLALQFQGLSVQLISEFSENYNLKLDYKIRKLIRLVSEEMKWNFYHDETLIKDLTAHLAAALNRAKAPMPESNNFLLTKIYDEYPELSLSIKQNLKEIFPKTVFLSNEVIYIVIHFASSYERNIQKPTLSALVICSSGVGTAKILESRLRKNIPEIKEIKISRISQLPTIKVEEYDLILSTIFLQGFNSEYKVVTPLLMEDEVKSIKHYIRKHTSKKGQKIKRKIDDIVPEHTDNDFRGFYEKISEANIILDYFDIIKVTDETELSSILSKISQQLEGTILNNPEQVKLQLERRMELTPIGLPETNMALFHTIDSSIQKPYFGIYELTHPIMIQAIDQQPIQMNRILLMLGPDPLSEHTQEILGSISSSIVASSKNSKLFNNGTKEEIRNYLSKIFLRKIKK
ncbi:BglG family transcription antiterminator [Jeotgalibaca sp. MA1X17-3]|uniref:BglG family transcription antiterminator n=1 Tax=Jeotgalibaca sp. MA1X17-3 TaxID=2908211 RepID=UPI001F2DC414|nr:BglG family transcription antiterminator [Jeotgalibaca sp. MA1X17-3]UJF15776.1 BglG family transcription antiterminator [Jeotgalibaca sp. MA1X17-3]